MKRLTTLLFTTLFPVFAGVEYVLPKDDSFCMSSIEGGQLYSKVNEDGEVLYKGLYRSIQYINLDVAEMYSLTPRQGIRDSWIETPGVSGLSGISDIWCGPYSPVMEDRYTAMKIPAKNGATFTVNVAKDVNITAPVAGRINTSHYACDGGSTTEHLIIWSDGNVYTMAVSDARYWYCRAHKPVLEGEPCTATAGDSLKEKAMRAGDVLCVGKEGTTISIVHTDT